MKNYLLVFMLLISSSTLWANETKGQSWVIQGQLKVAHQMPELQEAFGSEEALAGVQVKVSVRSKIPAGWGTWKKWATVSTDSNGNFRVSKTKGGDRRQFKISILFKNEVLFIKEGQETQFTIGADGLPTLRIDPSDNDWHLVFSDKESNNTRGRTAGTHTINITLNNGITRDHGGIWSLYTKAIDKMKAYGPAYAFKKRVKIKFPMGLGGNSNQAAPYANPANHAIYIKEGWLNVATLLHELMHIWSYERIRGEISMAWQLLKHKDTHQTRENTTYVPFMEGFADYGAIKLLKEITNGKIMRYNNSTSKPHVPASRRTIRNIVDHIDNVHYTEVGWISLFNMLTYKRLGKCNFNSPTTKAGTAVAPCKQATIGISFKQLLSTFLTNGSLGVDKYISTGEMTMNTYLDRVNRLLSDVDDKDIESIKIYLDPTATDNPFDLYCERDRNK